MNKWMVDSGWETGFLLLKKEIKDKQVEKGEIMDQN